MKPKEIKKNIFFVGALDPDRRLFDSLMPLPDGTSYNAFLVKGSEKTALLDTVDPSKASLLMSMLEGVERIDYIISHHSEQDHSGALPQVLDRYPGAKVLASPKGKELLLEHIHIMPEKIVTIADGETLSLGDKTLEFIYTPWVHWPETISTYLREDRVLFSCDLFGSHLSDPAVCAGSEQRVLDAAKRYYSEVMMPFRNIVHKHIEKFDKYQIDMIAPSHGPVHTNVKVIMDAHREWASYNLSNKAVIPFTTMHGSTEAMAGHLAESLAENGVKAERFNLATGDSGKMMVSLVDAATLVIGSPVMLTGAHPLAISAAFLINALKPKLRFASVIGSYGWGGKMVEQISSALSGLKLEMLDPVVIKGAPKDADYKSLEGLAKMIAAKHKENNITG